MADDDEAETLAIDDLDPLRTSVSNSRLVLVHGFAQNSRCWHPVDGLLAHAGWMVRRVDAPGHGRSGHDDADLLHAARLITDVGGAGCYVGYSMGGRMCLGAAIARPELVERLVLISTTAGIADPTARAERRRSDEELATTIEQAGLDAFLDLWMEGPLFRHLTPAQRHLAARRTNRGAGLAASLRHAGTGTQLPSWSSLPSLTMPVLVVAGAHDQRFAGLARQLVDSIGPNATLAIVEGAGHSVHLERPIEFARILTQWSGSSTP